MKACVITIGNEILKGKTVNTNAAEIGRMLYFAGYDVYRGLSVPDIKEEIGNAFRSLAGLCDVIVSSGGLGPTFDDITISSFADEFKIPIIVDEETYNTIKIRIEKRGVKMTKEREKMALVPKGSTVIRNVEGTAPGIEYHLQSTKIFILPGVPSEMRSMLKYIENRIKLSNSFYFEDSVLVTGIYEATLAPYITELMKEYNGKIYIKSHPTIKGGEESEIEVEVSAKSEKLESSKTLVTEVLRKISKIEAQLKSR